MKRFLVLTFLLVSFLLLAHVDRAPAKSFNSIIKEIAKKYCEKLKEKKR